MLASQRILKADVQVFGTFCFGVQREPTSVEEPEKSVYDGSWPLQTGSFPELSFDSVSEVCVGTSQTVPCLAFRCCKDIGGCWKCNLCLFS